MLCYNFLISFSPRCCAICQSVSRLVSLSVNQLVGWSVSRLIGWSSSCLPLSQSFLLYIKHEEIATLRSQQRIATLPTVVRNQTVLLRYWFRQPDKLDKPCLDSVKRLPVALIFVISFFQGNVHPLNLDKSPNF